MLKRINIASLSMLVLLCMLVPVPVQAATAANCRASGKSFLGFPTWYKYLEPKMDAKGNCELSLPQDKDGKASLGLAAVPILLAVLEILLRLGGLAAVIFIIYGGILYISSAGEPDKAKNGRTTIINAVAGLIIMMFATVIVSIIGVNL